MNAKTLDVVVLRSSDPRLLIAMTEREIIRSVLNFASACARGTQSGAWRLMIDFYRTSMARGRAGLTHRRLQSLLGAFDETKEFDRYEEFAEASIDDAVFSGFVLGAERLRSTLDQISADYEEAVVGPADDEAIELDEGQNIVEALIVQLSLHWSAVDDALTALANTIFLPQVPTENGPQFMSLLPIAQSEVMAVLRPKSAFVTFDAASTMPSLQASRLAMHRSWLGELFEHLSNPEILAARRPAPAQTPGNVATEASVVGDVSDLLRPRSTDLPSAFAKKKWTTGL